MSVSALDNFSFNPDRICRSGSDGSFDRSVEPLVKRVYQAFGPDKILWGELGTNMTEFQQAKQLLDLILDSASLSERAKIKGLNAKKLFAFS